jgi:hypothetical protein
MWQGELRHLCVLEETRGFRHDRRETCEMRRECNLSAARGAERNGWKANNDLLLLDRSLQFLLDTGNFSL